MRDYIPDFSDDDERDAFTTAMAARFADYSALIEHGIPKEDARFVLPYCFYSNFFCTLNGRELYHVLDAMLFGRGAGYPEIKRLGEQILEEVKAIAPGVFSRFMEHARTIEDSVLPGFIIPECVPTTPENKQKTELLAYTPQPERIVAQTALIEGTRCPTAQIDAILKDQAAVSGILDHVMQSERPVRWKCDVYVPVQRAVPRRDHPFGPPSDAVRHGPTPEQRIPGSIYHPRQHQGEACRVENLSKRLPGRRHLSPQRPGKHQGIRPVEWKHLRPCRDDERS